MFGTEWMWYQVGQKLHLHHICPPEINWCLHQLEWMCVVMWSDMVLYAFNPDTWEAKAEGLSWVSDQPGLPSEFLANQDFIARPYIRTNKQKIMGSECVMGPYILAHQDVFIAWYQETCPCRLNLPGSPVGIIRLRWAHSGFSCYRFLFVMRHWDHAVSVVSLHCHPSVTAYVRDFAL